VNAADEETLRGLPGVGPALAKRLIAYRDSNRGLRSPEDLAAAGLPPHILASVVGLVTFGPYSSGAQPTRGRVLDI
jgi:DNA uptake protein ComE-like DNA-binding protein